MNCSEIQPWLTSYLLGDLTPESEAEIKAHIDACEACRAAVREIEPTLGLLRDALAASSKAAEQLSSSRRERVLREGLAAQQDRRKNSWITRPHPILSRAATVLICVAIVAMLGILSLPAFLQYRGDSRRGLALNDLRLVDHASEVYAIKHGKDPQGVQDLDPYIDGEIRDDGGVGSVKWLGRSEAGRKEDVVAFKKMDDGAAVLYGDGTMTTIDEKEFKRSILPKAREKGMAVDEKTFRTAGRYYHDSAHEPAASVPSPASVPSASPLYSRAPLQESTTVDAEKSMDYTFVAGTGRHASHGGKPPSAGPAGPPPAPPAPPAVRIPSPPKSAPKALPGRGAGGGGDPDKMYDLSIDVVDAEERPAAIREITGGRAGGSRDRLDKRTKEDVAAPTADKPQEMVPATPSIKDLPILGRVNRRPEERGYPSAGGTMGAVADEDQKAPEKSKFAAESPADPFAQNVAKDGQNALSSDRFWATGSKGEAADEETQRWQELKEQNNELRQMAKELKDAVREIHESPAGGDRDGDRLESLGKAFNYDPQKPSPGDLRRMEETKAELVQQIDDHKKSIKKLTEVSVDSRGAGQPVTPEEKWVRGSQSYADAVSSMQVGSYEDAEKKARNALINGNGQAGELLGEIRRRKDMVPPEEPSTAGLRAQKPASTPAQPEMVTKSVDVMPSFVEVTRKAREELDESVALPDVTGRADELLAKAENEKKVEIAKTKRLEMPSSKTGEKSDTWEIDSGISISAGSMPANPDEANADLDGDGFANLEEFSESTTPKTSLPKAGDGKSREQTLLDKMAKIEIPEIEFRQANIHDVVRFLASAAQDFDPEGDTAKKRGVNVILNDGGETVRPAGNGAAAADTFAVGESSDEVVDRSTAGDLPLITFSAQHISLLEAMKIVSQISNTKMEVKDNHVMLAPMNFPDGDIIHRTYDVAPGLLKQVLGSDLLPDAKTLQKAKDGVVASDWKAAVTQMGVKWPEGTDLVWDKEAQKIRVRNTRENLSRLADALCQVGGPSCQTEAAKLQTDDDRRAEMQQEAMQTKLMAKMDSIEIPEVDFRQAKIGDVLHFLETASKDYDPVTGRNEQKGVSISCDKSLSVPKEGSGVPAVTFGARYISLRETLNIVTQMSGLKWFAAADGIHVVPANAPDGDVVEREINATPALTESIARDKAINSRNVQEKLKRLFGEMGVKWPAGSFITFVPSLGKLMVANTANGITLFEEKLSMLNDAEPSAPDPRFKAFGVNPFVDTAVNNFSTFGIDVDTASYTLARNYMQKGFLPPAESVRTEEFVNFFDHAYRPPERGLFAIYTEAAPSKFGHGLSLLKIGVKGRRLGREEQRQAVLTFVIDTSGSMNQPDRMGLIKKSLRMLVERLNPADQVAIVQYDSHARLLLEHTPASEKQRILAVIDAMECGGSTNLEEGMSKAYEIAARDFVSKAENRVLLLSDGVANLGTETADDILKNVEKYRQQGILCSVIGVGMGTYDDTMLESLANKGDGTYNFIDSEDEARRVFVDDLAATLNTIAKDVKIQVEFNPKRVARYRQMGYENRQLKKEQFRDDTVDAGEVGSGQSVTALYEMDVPDGVRTTAATSDSSMGDDVLAIVRVRYRDLATGKVDEIEQPVMATEMNSIFDEASPRFRLAACVAEFAEILRGSPFADGSTFPDLARVLRPVALELNLDKQVREVTRMVENAEGMSRGE